MSELSKKKDVQINAITKSDKYCVKASNLFVQNSFESAKKELKKALSCNPNNIHALILFGDILSETDSYRRALKYYDRAIEIEQNNPDPYYSKANTMLGEEEYREAEKYASMALELYKRAKRKDINLLELILDVLINSLIIQTKITKAKKLLKYGIQATKGSDILKSLNKELQRKQRKP